MSTSPWVDKSMGDQENRDQGTGIREREIKRGEGVVWAEVDESMGQ
jgi:hypothetical protein